jgi:hypothetical protein
MKVTIEKLDSCRRNVLIEIPKETIDEAFNKEVLEKKAQGAGCWISQRQSTASFSEKVLQG